MCLLLELCEAFFKGALSTSGNSNELLLCRRCNSGSSIPVAVLMRARFIILFIVFITALEETLKVPEIFQID
jgi:hypothetical protein